MHQLKLMPKNVPLPTQMAQSLNIMTLLMTMHLTQSLSRLAQTNKNSNNEDKDKNNKNKDDNDNNNNFNESNEDDNNNTHSSCNVDEDIDECDGRED